MTHLSLPALIFVLISVLIIINQIRFHHKANARTDAIISNHRRQTLWRLSILRTQ